MRLVGDALEVAAPADAVLFCELAGRLVHGSGNLRVAFVEILAITEDAAINGQSKVVHRVARGSLGHDLPGRCSSLCVNALLLLP